MTTIGDVHVGDVGTYYHAKIVDAETPFDPSSASESKLIFKPPKLAAIVKDATLTQDGEDWYLDYIVDDPLFHSTPGLWRWEGYVRFPDGQRYHTSVETYLVEQHLV